MLTGHLCAGKAFTMDKVTGLLGVVFTNDKEGEFQVEHAMVTVCKGYIPLKLCNITDHIVSVSQLCNKIIFEPFYESDEIFDYEIVEGGISHETLDGVCAVYITMSSVMSESVNDAFLSNDGQDCVQQGFAVVNSMDRTGDSIDGQPSSDMPINDDVLRQNSVRIGRRNSSSFGPNLQYIYEDTEFIPNPIRNPYASITPEELGTFPQGVKTLIDMRECVFHGLLLTDFITMIEENHEALMKHPLYLGYNSDLPLKLILKPNVAPFYQKPYRIPPSLEKEARDHLRTLEKLGVIREFFSNWSSPAFMVKKSQH